MNLFEMVVTSKNKFHGSVSKPPKELFLTMILLCLGACEFPSDLFTPRAVQVVRGDQTQRKIEKLESRVKKYEKIINAKVNAGEQLADVYETLALVYLTKENWQQSIVFFEKAIAEGKGSDDLTHKNLAVAYANRGKALADESDYKKAEIHYRRALELNPDNYEASYGLGIFLFLIKGEKPEGASLIEKVALAQPDFYEGRAAYARVSYELGMPLKSLDIYKSLLDDLSRNKLMPELQNEIIANMSRITEETSQSQDGE